MTDFPGHQPVLLKEVIEGLNLQQGAYYLDGTFGGGGYTEAILREKNCSVLAVDQDVEAVKRAKSLQESYGQRLQIRHGRFSQMGELYPEYRQKLKGVVLDIGVSSFQIDDAPRGFSFKKSGPLDMRMNQEDTLTAADVVNNFEEEELANIIYKFGEEKYSRRIARRIMIEREKESIQTTGRLASIIRSVVRGDKKGIDPATKTFQALRIYVNQELEELKKGLEAAEQLLDEGGRLVVVSFHSLEDRVVKEHFRHASLQAGGGSRHQPLDFGSQKPATLRVVIPALVRPSGEESAVNPRARSARMRVAERINRVRDQR